MAANGFLRKFAGGRKGNKKNQKEQASSNTASAATVETISTMASRPCTVEPPRKRKSADRMQIIVSCPPWKPPCVGDVFPNLNGLHTISTKDEGIRTLPGFNYYDYLADCNDDDKVSASWGIMLVFPGRTFSQVCISELKALSKLSAEFRKAKVKVCGFTANPRDTNRAWIEEAESTVNDDDNGECTKIDFPIFCDNSTFDNAVEMGTLDEEKTSEYDVPILYRSTFIIRPDRTIAMTFQQASNVGRDFKCILEFVESLQKGYTAAGSDEENVSSADELVLSSY